jgi:hypothetical protein
MPDCGRLSATMRTALGSCSPGIIAATDCSRERQQADCRSAFDHGGNRQKPGQMHSF